jgi:hypothetical protein
MSKVISIVLAGVALAVIIPGSMWLSGWLIVNGVNLLAQRQTLPATHLGYLAAGCLLWIARGVFANKGKS